MQFSDTSTRQGLIQDCEDLLNLGDTGISGNSSLLKTFTRFINAHYRRVVTLILAAQDSWDFDDSNNSDYPIGTIPLTTNRDVTLPASAKVLKIKRVDVTYDGSTWYKAELLDSGQMGIGLGNDTNTDSSFSKTKPYYDVIGSNGLWIYPSASSADVAAGAKLRIEFYRDITEFTTGSTTSEPGFDTPFHRILSLGAALDYAIIKNLPQQQGLATLLTDYQTRLQQYYGQKDTDTQFYLRGAYTSYE